MTRTTERRVFARLLGSSLTLVVVGLVLATAASAATPQNTALPTTSGNAKEGSTLTATNGTWSNNPTSFAYQWQRCATDGTACGDISGATRQSYTLVSGDVHHTLRVAVTAKNSDGAATARSDATDVVGSKNGPSNTVRPSASGSAVVGETLTVSNGSWSPSATSFQRQWQRCQADGTGCLNIDGATGMSYGVRTIDAGNRLRALVTAHTAAGQTTVASSNSDIVQTSTVTTTTTVTTPSPRAPTLSFISLKHRGHYIYARFRVCTQLAGRVRITEHDFKARALPYTRHFSVFTASCGAFHKKWLLLPRYRHPGRYVVTLRAADRAGHLSRLVSRSLMIR